MCLSGVSVGWTSCYKYLGVTFGLLSGPQFKIYTDVIRRKLYAGANTVLANSLHVDHIVRLHLVESYCLPVLQYCYPAIKLSNVQIKIKLTRCIAEFFVFTSGKVLKRQDRLAFKHIYALARLKFVKSLSSIQLTQFCYVGPIFQVYTYQSEQHTLGLYHEYEVNQFYSYSQLAYTLQCCNCIHENSESESCL